MKIKMGIVIPVLVLIIFGSNIKSVQAAGPPSVNQDINSSIGFDNILNSLKLLADPDPNADPGIVLEKRILNIINFLFALGSALMFFMAVWSGLIYIFSFGNEDATTKAKKNFVNIVTGLVVMLGSFSLLQILRYIITTGKFGP